MSINSATDAAKMSEGAHTNGILKPYPRLSHEIDHRTNNLKIVAFSIAAIGVMLYIGYIMQQNMSMDPSVGNRAICTTFGLLSMGVICIFFIKTINQYGGHSVCSKYC